MPIRYANPGDNIFHSGSEAFVNPVNCKGVMGAGLALQFKELFPYNFAKYEAYCKRGLMRLGRIYTVRLTDCDTPKMIINFPTKGHWRERSTYASIEAGLENMASQIMFDDINSVSIPALGCGLGGLDWAKIQHLIEKGLERAAMNRNILIFPPGN